MKRFMEQLPIEGITDIKTARGGDVNEAFTIHTDQEKYFMLLQKGRDASFYAGEMEGLRLFEEIGITAPRVIASGEIDGDAYLILSFLEEGHSGSQRELAETVVKLHQYLSPTGQFGFDYPHSGRDTSFTNAWVDTWAEVIVNQRLDVLAEQLQKMGLWSDEDLARYGEARIVILDTLSRHESQPSLLHGDLWGGNYMFLEDGTPALFDPSPLFGDREFDLGITTVFGGFGPMFYERYQEILPMEGNYKLRLEFYRLYLFMVHLVKFGETYRSSVERSLTTILQS